MGRLLTERKARLIEITEDTTQPTGTLHRAGWVADYRSNYWEAMLRS